MLGAAKPCHLLGDKRPRRSSPTVTAPGAAAVTPGRCFLPPREHGARRVRAQEGNAPVNPSELKIPRSTTPAGGCRTSVVAGGIPALKTHRSSLGSDTVSPSWHLPASICPPLGGKVPFLLPAAPSSHGLTAKERARQGKQMGLRIYTSCCRRQLSSQVRLLKTSALELLQGSPMGSGDTRGLLSPLLPLPASPAVPHALQSHC